MKTNYKIVSAETVMDLAEFVQKKLDDGWDVHGTPFAFGIRICQAMIKPEKVVPIRGMNNIHAARGQHNEP